MCGRAPAPGKNLNVDHDHKTGLLRGLLCWRCNRRVVADHRDPDGTFLLRQAAQYLEDPPAIGVVGEVFGRKGRITNKRRRRKKKAA